MQDVCANFVVEQIVLQVVRARMPNLAEVLSGIMPLHMPNLQINEIKKKKDHSINVSCYEFRECLGPGSILLFSILNIMATQQNLILNLSTSGIYNK